MRKQALDDVNEIVSSVGAPCKPIGSRWITTNRPAESLSQTILVPVTLWLPFAVP